LLHHSRAVPTLPEKSVSRRVFYYRRRRRIFIFFFLYIRLGFFIIITAAVVRVRSLRPVHALSIIRCTVLVLCCRIRFRARSRTRYTHVTRLHSRVRSRFGALRKTKKSTRLAREYCAYGRGRRSARGGDCGARTLEPLFFFGAPSCHPLHKDNTARALKRVVRFLQLTRLFV